MGDSYTLFRITKEDVWDVINEKFHAKSLTDEEYEQIYDHIRYKMEIPWSEYVEESIRFILRGGYKQ